MFEVIGGRLAAKVLFGGTSANRVSLRARLAAVRRLPLDGLPIARPLELLAAPQVGYLMPLLKGMAPIRTLVRPVAPARPSPDWYAHTGGLRRRLRVLARVADAFARLHGRAIAYGDLSPTNVLVSERVDGEEVWLIDGDNLSFESSPIAAATMLFTPGYGAPELFSGRSGVNTLTDAHALAVLAFQTLVLTHPLLGDRVVEGDPALEEDAYAGSLPWIDHPTDETNRSSHGIRRDAVLAPRLAKLFGQAFGPGLVDSLRRPGTTALADALHSAADFTSRCSQCLATHYANAKNCPWCAAPATPFVLGRVYRWDPTDGVTVGAKLLHAFVVEQDTPYDVPARIAGARWTTGTIHLMTTPKGVDVWTSGQVQASIAMPDGSRRHPLHHTPVTLPVTQETASWFIHMGEPNAPHRIITLSAARNRA